MTGKGAVSGIRWYRRNFRQVAQDGEGLASGTAFTRTYARHARCAPVLTIEDGPQERLFTQFAPELYVRIEDAPRKRFCIENAPELDILVESAFEIQLRLQDSAKLYILIEDMAGIGFCLQKTLKLRRLIGITNWS